MPDDYCQRRIEFGYYVSWLTGAFSPEIADPKALMSSCMEIPIVPADGMWKRVLLAC